MGFIQLAQYSQDFLQLETFLSTLNPEIVQELHGVCQISVSATELFTARE
jgi:hypothetical protein